MWSSISDLQDLITNQERDTIQWKRKAARTVWPSGTLGERISLLECSLECRETPSIKCVGPCAHTVEGEGDTGYPLQDPGISFRRWNLLYMPPMFDRSAPWEAFNAQFEIVSHVNGWTREERLHFLVQA